MPDYGRLSLLRLGGKRLADDVRDAVTTAPLSLSTGEVSQLVINLRDDNRLSLLNRLNLTAGTPTTAGTRLRYADLNLELRALEIGQGPTVTLTARPFGVGELRRARGGRVWRHISPTQWAHLAARHAGLRFVGQPTSARGTIHRKAHSKSEPGETSWDTLQRLAQELGFLAFEAADVLYFAEPTYLVRHADERLRLRWSGAGTDPRILSIPNVRRSGDDARRYATVDAKVTAELGDDVRPGSALELTGLPGFHSTYLVTAVTFDTAKTTGVAITAETPTNPEPQPPDPAPEKPSKASSTAKPKKVPA